MFLIFSGLTLQSVRRIPNKYTSSATFNFHSDFSKIPASSEFFSDIYDPNELRAQKEAILLGVLSDSFLSELASKYIGKQSAQAEWLANGSRKDIKFVPLSRTTYQLIVEHRDPETTHQMAWDILARLEETLRTERLTRMQTVYSSVTQQLSELSIHGTDKDMSIDLNAARLRLENEIAKLEGTYTAEHPRLAGLRKKLYQLNKPFHFVSKDPMNRGQLENWATLRGILLTRQALLQIAIRMEEKATISHITIVKDPVLPQQPSSPKRLVLYISSILTSLVFAFSIAAVSHLLKDLLFIFPELKKSWSQFSKELHEHRSGENQNKGV
jgi:hypothetical protein